MPVKQDLTGQRFGFLTVTGRTEPDEKGRRRWVCLCDCGAITYKATDQLTNPDVSMCRTCAQLYGAQKARENGGYESGTQRTKLNTKTQESENRSGIRGVYLDGKTGKYRARIKFRGVTHNLGTFLTLEAAVKARSTADQELFGTFLEGGE